ncbi:MAG: DUF167 domain-containing protein [Phycisphaerae bacterium]
MELSWNDGAVLLPVKVVPGASRTRCAGVLGERLKIAVAAPPEKGKANAELVAFLAQRIGVRRRDVLVQQGKTTPRKTVRIENTTIEQVRRALGISNG